MTDKLWEVTGELVQSGIYPGLANKESPLWADGQNVVFTERSAQPSPGQAVLIPSVQDLPVRVILETVISGVRTVFYGTQTKLFKWDEASATVTTLGTGFNADYWTAFRWGDWSVFCPWPNGTIQVWKPGSGLAAITGLGGLFSRGRSSLAYRQLGMIFGTDTDPTAFRWSDIDNLEQFVQSASVASGRQAVLEAESPLLASVVYQRQVYFATSASLFIANWLGAPLYFGSTIAVKGAGVFGPYSLCVGGDNLLYGFGPNGLWRTDGTQMLPIDIPAVHDKVYDRMNSEYSFRCSVYHDMQTKHVVFNYPVGDAKENTEAVAWNYVDRNWAPSSQHRTVAADSGIFRSPLLGDANGQVWAQILTGVPLSGDQSADIGLASIARMSVGYGMGGYGSTPYGGSYEFGD